MEKLVLRVGLLLLNQGVYIILSVLVVILMYTYVQVFLIELMEYLVSSMAAALVRYIVH